MNSIDAVVYINLERRTDRRELVEAELRTAGFEPSRIHRFNAVAQDDNGNLGCSMSHVGAMRLAIESGWKRVLFLEDDFQLKTSPEVFQTSLKDAFEFLRDDFDVLMLAHSTQSFSRVTDSLIKILQSQTRCAYVVNMEFSPVLLKNFEEAVELMKTHGRGMKGAYGDQHWKLLQPKSRWYAFHPALAKQRAGFSDNEKRFTNYGV